MLHVDGKIFRSLRLLLTRPGFSDTRNLRRAARELRIADAAVSGRSAFSRSRLARSAASSAVNVEYTPSPGEDSRPARNATCEESSERAVGAAMNEWLPRAMFVLVPLFAALVMLVRRRSGHNYPQHLYFALHVHAMWFFAMRSMRCSRRSADRRSSRSVSWYWLTIWHRRLLLRGVSAASTPRRCGARLWRCAVIGLLYWVALMVAVLAIMLRAVMPLMFVLYSVMRVRLRIARRHLLIADGRARARTARSRPRRRGRGSGVPDVSRRGSRQRRSSAAFAPRRSTPCCRAIRIHRQAVASRSLASRIRPDVRSRICVA